MCNWKYYKMGIPFAPVGMGAVDVGVAYEAFTLAAAKNLGKEMVLHEGL